MNSNRIVLVTAVGLAPSYFELGGFCDAHFGIQGWPHRPRARQQAAAAVVTMLNETPEITHVVMGVSDEPAQVCAAHATHDLIRFSPLLCRQPGRPDLVFEVVKVAPYGCTCLVTGAFNCGPFRLRPHGQQAVLEMLTVDLTHTLQGA